MLFGSQIACFFEPRIRVFAIAADKSVKFFRMWRKYRIFRDIVEQVVAVGYNINCVGVNDERFAGS